MVKKALLVIDYSNDFIHDKGSMTGGKPAQDLDPYLVELMRKFVQNGDYIFVCNDAHQKDDAYNPETVLFPAHNLEGSWGQQIYGKTGEYLEKLLKEKSNQVYYLPKKRFSAFVGTSLALMLRERKVESLVLGGVCTDICVLHTAASAIYEGFEVSVAAKACQTAIPGGQEWALNHFEKVLGAKLV